MFPFFMERLKNFGTRLNSAGMGTWAKCKMLTTENLSLKLCRFINIKLRKIKKHDPV